MKLFGSLKTYAYGASPMPLPLLRAALKAWPNTDFIQAYGLTEVCGVISHLLPDAHRAGYVFVEDRLMDMIISGGESARRAPRGG